MVFNPSSSQREAKSNFTFLKLDQVSLREAKFNFTCNLTSLRKSLAFELEISCFYHEKLVIKLGHEMLNMHVNFREGRNLYRPEEIMSLLLVKNRAHKEYRT